jgi:hypothetical protein
MRGGQWTTIEVTEREEPEGVGIFDGCDDYVDYNYDEKRKRKRNGWKDMAGEGILSDLD